MVDKVTSMVTIAGRSKMAQARAGVAPLPKIVGMAFGSGGVDANGQVREWNIEDGELHAEVLRKNIESVEEITETCYRYFGLLDVGEDLAGQYISEIGLYDESGDIVALKSFLAKGKDTDVAMRFYIDDQF